MIFTGSQCLIMNADTNQPYGFVTEAHIFMRSSDVMRISITFVNTTVVEGIVTGFKTVGKSAYIYILPNDEKEVI